MSSFWVLLYFIKKWPSKETWVINIISNNFKNSRNELMNIKKQCVKDKGLYKHEIIVIKIRTNCSLRHVGKPHLHSSTVQFWKFVSLLLLLPRIPRKKTPYPASKRACELRHYVTLPWQAWLFQGWAPDTLWVMTLNLRIISGAMRSKLSPFFNVEHSHLIIINDKVFWEWRQHKEGNRSRSRDGQN